MLAAAGFRNYVVSESLRTEPDLMRRQLVDLTVQRLQALLMYGISNDRLIACGSC